MDDGGARDAAIGALVGLAVGDAVGTTLEFTTPGTFEPITDMLGGGPFGLRPGQFTDDTSMAMCLAESILDVAGLDPADQLRRYLVWWREGYWSSTGACFDIGGATADALRGFEQTGALTPPLDQERAANGSLMRLAAVPIRWHVDLAEAAERSAESSRTTHPAGRPVDACRLMGAMLAALIRGSGWDEATAEEFWDLGALHPDVEAVARGSWRRREPPEIRGSGYSVAALEAAMWAVGGAADYADAVLRAANLGDDADTTAAIAGQLAGARWGVSGIPARWLEQLTERERIEGIAGRLYDVGAGTGIPAWPHESSHHAYWVEPGAVLAGQHPGRADPVATRHVLDLLVDHGVRTFVDLTGDGEAVDPYDAALDQVARLRGLELRHVRHPIPDFGVLPDGGYDAVVDAIRVGAVRGGVYVHCRGGVGRTGTVVGCLLIDSGLTGEEAFVRIAELRASSRGAGVDSPETDDQRDVIRRRGRVWK